MSVSKRVTKLSIPHPADCTIVGTLEQWAPDEPTKGQKIALVGDIQALLSTVLTFIVGLKDFTWNHGASLAKSNRHRFIKTLAIGIKIIYSKSVLQTSCPSTRFVSTSGTSAMIDRPEF